jgi:hypothetical protein
MNGLPPAPAETAAGPVLLRWTMITGSRHSPQRIAGTGATTCPRHVSASVTWIHDGVTAPMLIVVSLGATVPFRARFRPR